MKVNKIILFLFVLCISIFIFSNSSYAMEISFSEDYPSFEVPDDLDIGEKQGTLVALSQNISRKPIYLYYFYNLDPNINHFLLNEQAGGTSSYCYFGDYANSNFYFGSTRIYELKDNVWSYIRTIHHTSSTMHYTVNSDNPEYIYSDFDIYDYHTRELFFQKTPQELPTLVEETLEMITQETPKAVATITPQMKTILLCGVGCLALLVALPILLKVFWKFL